MTEKRFIFHKKDGDVEDCQTGEFYSVDQYRFDIGLVRKMNELNDENERLKKENKDLEDFRYGVFKSIANFQEKMRGNNDDYRKK